jgi:hypothetical protein
LYILKDLGPFNPLNPNSFERLTTEKLMSLISSGISVYAFEPDPIVNSPTKGLDGQAFSWTEDTVVDLGEAKERLGLRQDIANRLPSGVFTLYRANLAKASWLFCTFGDASCAGRLR